MLSVQHWRLCESLSTWDRWIVAPCFYLLFSVTAINEKCMDENTIKNIQQCAKVIAPIESYDLSKDKRLLIPFVYGEELGFFNQDLDVVVSPKYITYHGECYGKEDYVVTVKRIPCYLGYTNIYFYGIIDYQGKEVLPVEYFRVWLPYKSNTLFTVENDKRKYAVMNSEGKEVIPFGKYTYIDGASYDYFRVKVGGTPDCLEGNGAKWGIINSKGEEVVPIRYDFIQPFYQKDKASIYLRLYVPGGYRCDYFKLYPSK